VVTPAFVGVPLNVPAAASKVSQEGRAWPLDRVAVSLSARLWGSMKVLVARSAKPLRTGRRIQAHWPASSLQHFV